MLLVDGLQSAIMYRTVKLLYGCGNVFVLYPLIIYVLSTTLLLATEGAQAPPPQRDIKEAEQIVGRFLRNEAGTTWLSGLAKSRSAPLTTQDLMNEIMAATRPEGKVWKAASILNESLKDEALKGIETKSILGQAENWKDLIEHIENENDIICLYRKSNENATEKEDDWKKFLRTVSSGYTVHLAIDTGHKYVICLKKIEVPETTSEDIMTTEEIMITEQNLSTVDTSVDPTSVKTETVLQKTSEKPENIVPQESLKTPNGIRPNNSSDEICSDEDQGSGNGQKGGVNGRDIKWNNGVDLSNEDMFEEDGSMDSSEEKYLIRRGMDNRLVAEFEHSPVKSRKTWRSPNPPSMKKNELDSSNNGWPLASSHPITPDGLNTLSSKDPECNRPIILVMQNGNGLYPLGYGPGIPLGIPIQRNHGAATLPRFPLHSALFPTMPRTPQLPLTSHPPTHFSKIPEHPFNPFMQSILYPPLSKPNNLGRPIVDQSQIMYMAGLEPIRSQNPNFLYEKSRGKNHFVQSYAQPFVQPAAQSNMMSIARPILQTARSAFLPQPMNIKSRAEQPDLVQDLTSPVGNYMPRVNGDQSDPRIPNSHIHRPINNVEWNGPSKNVGLLRRNEPVNAHLVNYNLLAQARNADRNRQLLQNYESSQLPPRTSIFGPRLPVTQNPVKRPTGQANPLLIDTRNPAGSSPITSPKLLAQPRSVPFRCINRNNSPFTNLLRRNPPNCLRQNPPKLLRQNPPDLLRQNPPNLLRQNPPDLLRQNPPNLLRQNPPNLLRQNAPNQNVLRQNPANQNLLRQNPPNQNLLRQNPLNQNLLRQNLPYQNLLRQNPLNQNLLRQNLPYQNLLRQNPLTQNLLRQNPPTQNLLRQNPPNQNLLRQNSPNQNLLRQNPPNQNLLRQNPPNQNLLRQNPQNLNLLRQNPPNQNLLRQNPPNLNLLRQNPPNQNLLRQNPPNQNLLRQNPPNLNLLRQNPPTQNLLRQNPPNLNLLRQNPPTQNLYRNPLPNLNPNYAMTNKFVQPNVLTPTALPLMTRPCFILWSTLHAISRNNQNAINSLMNSLTTCKNRLLCTQARNQLEGSSEQCPSPCHRPVKLQILINGKVQEPLQVSVISEPGQHIEIVGSDKTMIPYGARSLREETPLLSYVEDDDQKVHFEVSEVKKQSNNSDEVTTASVDEKEEVKQEKEKNMTDAEVSPVESTTDQREKLYAENISTMESTTETMFVGPETETSGGPEIEERFLHEVTTETSSKYSTVEVNTTVSAIMNSTIVEV